MRNFILIIALFSGFLQAQEAYFSKNFQLRMVHKADKSSFVSIDEKNWIAVNKKDSANGYVISAENIHWFVVPDTLPFKKVFINHQTEAISMYKHPIKNFSLKEQNSFWRDAFFTGKFVEINEKEVLQVNGLEKKVRYMMRGDKKWTELTQVQVNYEKMEITAKHPTNFAVVTLTYNLIYSSPKQFYRAYGEFPPFNFDIPPFDDGTVVKKPVTYFYSDKNESFTFDVQTIFTETDPKYTPSGWKLQLNQNQLIHQNKKIPYVFWEGFKKDIQVQENEGWVIETKNLEAFMREKMTKMGFSEQETNECVAFWKNEFKEPFLEIYPAWISESQSNVNGKLYASDFPENISPAPDHYFRLCWYFKQSKVSKTLAEPQLIKAQRTGFYMMEWGGADLSSSKKSEIAD